MLGCRYSRGLFMKNGNGKSFCWCCFLKNFIFLGFRSCFGLFYFLGFFFLGKFIYLVWDDIREIKDFRDFISGLENVFLFGIDLDIEKLKRYLILIVRKVIG